MKIGDRDIKSFVSPALKAGIEPKMNVSEKTKRFFQNLSDKVNANLTRIREKIFGSHSWINSNEIKKILAGKVTELKTKTNSNISFHDTNNIRDQIKEMQVICAFLKKGGIEVIPLENELKECLKETFNKDTEIQEIIHKDLTLILKEAKVQEAEVQKAKVQEVKIKTLKSAKEKALKNFESFKVNFDKSADMRAGPHPLRAPLKEFVELARKSESFDTAVSKNDRLANFMGTKNFTKREYNFSFEKHKEDVVKDINKCLTDSGLAKWDETQKNLNFKDGEDPELADELELAYYKAMLYYDIP